MINLAQIVYESIPDYVFMLTLSTHFLKQISNHVDFLRCKSTISEQQSLYMNKKWIMKKTHNYGFNNRGFEFAKALSYSLQL